MPLTPSAPCTTARARPRDGEGQQDTGHDDQRDDDQIVQQGATDDEPGQVPGAGVEAFLEDAPHAPCDDGPADDGRDPEQRASTVVVVLPRRKGGRAHTTATLVTHLVWRTPARFGAIRRQGNPWSRTRGSPSR